MQHQGALVPSMHSVSAGHVVHSPHHQQSMASLANLHHGMQPPPVTSHGTVDQQQGQHAEHSHSQEARKQEIGDILQQIMTITDQSLDEAQAR